MATKASRPKRASTPANKADAMGMGIRPIKRSNQPVMPKRVMSAAQTMKAATASPMLNAWPSAVAAAAAVASTAAPGVLQATITGFFNHKEGKAEHKPMPKPKAHIQELTCAGVAPKLVAA